MKRPLLHTFLKRIGLFEMAKSIYFLLNKFKILRKYKTQTGLYYLPFFAFKDAIRNSIIQNQIFDKHIFDTAKKYILPNSIVIDAGANYGQYSILFSKVSNEVEVYSFEANKFVFEILKKNIKANNIKAKIFNNLLGNISKSLINIEKTKLKTPDYGSQSFKIVSDTDSEQIEAIKIDDLKFDKKISLLKIDVEGMDYDVLIGAKNTIKIHKMPIIFEFIKDKNKHSFGDYEKFIKAINYYISQKIDETNYLIKHNGQN